MLICVCLRILASSRIPRYDLGRQTPHFWGGSVTLYLSLFMWSTTRWGPLGMWQHRSSPLGEARPGPRGSVGAHLDREARSEAEEHVVASELSSRGGRSRSHGARGSAGAHLDREVRPGAEKHMAAPKLNSARRRGFSSRATWQHRSSPQQGGEVRGRETHGGSEAHFCREAWSEVTTYVVACRCTPCSLSWLKAYMRGTRPSGCQQIPFFICLY
jgi:hypothetical protein